MWTEDANKGLITLVLVDFVVHVQPHVQKNKNIITRVHIMSWMHKVISLFAAFSLELVPAEHTALVIQKIPCCLIWKTARLWIIYIYFNERYWRLPDVCFSSCSECGCCNPVSSLFKPYFGYHFNERLFIFANNDLQIELNVLTDCLGLCFDVP